MKTEKVFNGIRFTLSNENLAVGDKVYPIAWGRCLDGGGWIFHNYDYKLACSGFPTEPHTILDLHHSDYKPYEVRTKEGYGPIESYYKIIKTEKQETEPKRFGLTKWVETEINIDEIKTEDDEEI